MISEATVEAIRQVTDIAEVVQDFVPLKKRGRNLMACCPFHNEKTPSFSVSPDKGFYKCFGCGKAGDAITFLREHEGFSYVEALRYLARKYHITVDEETPTDEQQAATQARDSVLLALDFARERYEHYLHHTEEGQGYALSYLRERGFQDSTIRTFQLGYSPDQWTTLTDEALQKGYSEQALTDAGLTVVKDEGKKRYDRFRGRVMFPIQGVTGKTLAFGARILKRGNQQGQPKYLNSPETPVYHKGKVLYGLFQAKTHLRQADNCYLVEGYTDVISLHQAGVPNVVAASGTALTEEQIALIRRYTRNVTMLYDGDPAGLKASLRGVDLALAQGLNVRIVAFPEGQDPDSYARQLGGEAFRAYLKAEAQDFITFQVSLLAPEARQDPIRQAELIRQVVGSISLVPDAIQRAVFFQRCSEQLGVDEQVLITESNRLRRSARQRTDRQDAPPPEAEPTAIASPSPRRPNHWEREGEEREIVRMLLAYADLPVGATDGSSAVPLCAYLLEETRGIRFESAACARIVALFQEYFERDKAPPSPTRFTQSDEPAVQQLAIELLAERHQLSADWETRYRIFTPTDQEVVDQHAYRVVLRLKKKALQQLRQRTIDELPALTPTEQDAHLRRIMEMDKILRAITGELGTVVNG